MKTSEAKMLIKTGAIERATIYITKTGEIEIWLDADDLHPSITQRLETTRKDIRNPATLDAAFSIIRALGWKYAVKIDGNSPA